MSDPFCMVNCFFPVDFSILLLVEFLRLGTIFDFMHSALYMRLIVSLKHLRIDYLSDFSKPKPELKTGKEYL